MNMANMKTRTKILAVIGILAIVAVGISTASIWALKRLSDSTNEMELAGKEAALGARLRQHVVALNRAEYRIAADPTGDNYVHAKQDIAKERKEFEERLAQLRSTADEQQAHLLDRIEKAYKVYLVELEDTIRTADKNAASVNISGAQQEIVKSVLASHAKALAFEDDATAFVDYAAKKVHFFSDDATATYQKVSIGIMVGAALGILIGLALGLVISQKGIVNPIRQIVACLQALSKGDLTVAIFGAERADEVGDIGKTAQVFKDNLVEAERLRAEQKAEQDRQLERGKKMEAAVAEFDKVISEVVAVVSSAASELQSTAESLSATAEETTRQSNAVAAASEQMTQNVQTVASATEELSSSISEIGKQVSESTLIVGNAVTQAEDTNTKVDGLSEAAKKIGDVVTLINEIASQTNLLALNATIEAARAGEAGKGFAVVASEVKSLASQTAKATEEIAGQVRAIQESTESSAQAIQMITQTINRVNDISTTIASAVEEQGSATQEISRNVQQAAAGTAEVTSNISGVTEASQHTSAGSTQVLGAASELAENGERLKHEVENFLHKVRSL